MYVDIYILYNISWNHFFFQQCKYLNLRKLKVGFSQHALVSPLCVQLTMDRWINSVLLRVLMLLIIILAMGGHALTSTQTPCLNDGVMHASSEILFTIEMSQLLKKSRLYSMKLFYFQHFFCTHVRTPFELTSPGKKLRQRKLAENSFASSFSQMQNFIDDWTVTMHW